MKKIFILLFLILITACQSVGKVEKINFDNNQLTKFDMLSTSIQKNIIFEKKISNPYIGHTLEINPTERIVSWIDDNFKAIGNENIFYINIIDASLTMKEVENNDAQKFDEKNIYKYEIFYLVEYNLFDDTNNLIRTTLVESTRSTTSAMYISINEQDNIINDLIYLGLLDLSNKSKELLSKYMSDYII